MGVARCKQRGVPGVSFFVIFILFYPFWWAAGKEQGWPDLSFLYICYIFYNLDEGRQVQATGVAGFTQNLFKEI